MKRNTFDASRGDTEVYGLGPRVALNLAHERAISRGVRQEVRRFASLANSGVTLWIIQDVR